MGDDAPPAFLSSARRPLWDYCKQSFAQVTNPAIDPLREAHVMSLETCLGGTGDCEFAICSTPRRWLPLRKVCSGAPARSISLLTPRVERMRPPPRSNAFTAKARDASSTHSRVVVLSDNTASPARRGAARATRACSAAWKGMLETGAHDVPLIVETGQAVETHHAALLIAMGASAVYPYPCPRAR